VHTGLAEALGGDYFGPPHRAEDGRADAEAPDDVGRTARGGAWLDDPLDARAACRNANRADGRDRDSGLRVAVSALSPISVSL
jgi:formylglycine-generating enzyme required for sulfatase activity